MVRVLTSHNHIWNIDRVTADIIYEYQTTGSVLIVLNGEGPCASSVGLFDLLDYVSDKFGLDKSKICIKTANSEETGNGYAIQRLPQHWVTRTVDAFNLSGVTVNKSNNLKLFGLLYNVPSWDRLCLLAYANNLQSESLMGCNGTWESRLYNTYYLNEVTEYCPSEIYNIVDYLKTNPTSVTNNLIDKPVTAEAMLEISPMYNEFLIDIVAETYVHGKSFFITEKTLRPMLMLTPFVINGPQGFLSTLKSDYGVKSFDRWWPEDYDQYQNYDRILKIYEVMDMLDKLSKDERIKMYHDMMPILEHNRKCLLK